MTKIASAMRVRPVVAIRALLATAAVALVTVPALTGTSSAADFSNPAPIVVPTPPPPMVGGVFSCPGTAQNSLVQCPQDKANLYPSPIPVSGLTGTITNVTVTLKDLSWQHDGPSDADIMLIGPDGKAVMVMSDACGDTPMPTTAGLTFTLDDNAAASLPTSGCTSGTFKPTDIETSECIPFRTPDAFPPPSPVAQPTSSSLADFRTTAPNGTWNLYVVDDCPANEGPPAGSIAGGWTVSLTTTGGGGATTSSSTPGAPPTASTTTTASGGGGTNATTSTTSTSSANNAAAPACTTTTGTQDAGSASVGQTMTVELTPTCPFSPLGAVNIAVNGQTVATKTPTANGTVRVSITVVSPTTLSIDDPVLVPGHCGANTVEATGPSSPDLVGVTQTATLNVLCPATPLTPGFVPQSSLLTPTLPFPLLPVPAPQQQQQQQQSAVASSRAAPAVAAPAPASSSAVATAPGASSSAATPAGASRLPFTGSNVYRWTVLGLVLVALGASCLLTGRWRLRRS